MHIGPFDLKKLYVYSVCIGVHLKLQFKYYRFYYDGHNHIIYLGPFYICWVGPPYFDEDTLEE